MFQHLKIMKKQQATILIKFAQTLKLVWLKKKQNLNNAKKIYKVYKLKKLH